MPFLKDFIINNSTKIILWNIIPGELDDKHISKEEIGLLKIRKGKKSKEYFLAARKLLKNEDSELTIEYDSKGKPHLNKKKGISISDPEAREHIYGMPYLEWKEKYQK